MIGDVNNTLTTLLDAGAEPLLSPDSIDLLAAKDIGAGTTFKVTFFVTEAITNGTATQIQYQVGLADDDAGTNFTVIGQSAFITFAAALAAATEVRCNQLYGSVGRRFLKVRFLSNDGANFTNGTVVAKVSINVDSGDGGKPYPSGYVFQT